MIIGANTFNTVEAQLRQIRNESCSLAPPPPPPPMSDVSYREESGSGLDLPLSGRFIDALWCMLIVIG